VEKLHTDVLHNFYSSPYIIKVIPNNEDKMGRVCSEHGEMRNRYTIFAGKPEGKIPLGRPKIDGRIILNVIREIGVEVIDWDR
jgi:hypothetical protein